MLGESVSDDAHARATADEYVALLGDVAAAGLNANVSVKLTALGLEIEPELALNNVRRVVEAALGHGNFVRVDMEHSSVTDQTIGIYKKLRGEGYDNVGIVLQAYLRRTEDDLAVARPSDAVGAAGEGDLRRVRGDRLHRPRRDQPRVRRHGWRISSRRAARWQRQPMTRR